MATGEIHKTTYGSYGRMFSIYDEPSPQQRQHQQLGKHPPPSPPGSLHALSTSINTPSKYIRFRLVRFKLKGNKILTCLRKEMGEVFVESFPPPEIVSSSETSREVFFYPFLTIRRVETNANVLEISPES